MITPPLQFLRRSTPIRKPTEAKYQKLGDTPALDPLIHVFNPHPVMPVVQPTEQVPILFFGMNFSLGHGVVELDILQWVFGGAYLFGEEVLEVGSFVTSGDGRMFGEFFPVFLEICVVPFYSLRVLVLDLGSE